MPRFALRLPVAAFLAASVLSPPTAGSQVRAVDSVRAFEALPDTEQVLTLNAQAWALRRSEPALAIATAKRSLEFARRIGFKRAEAQVLNYLGVGYEWLGDSRKAQTYFFDALAVADSAGSTVEQGYALNNIASVLLTEGDGEHALQYAQRALALHEATANIRGVAYAQSRLASIESALGRHEDALQHARTAFRIWTQLGDISTSLTARRNMAIAYEGKRQYSMALEELLKIDRSDSLPAATRLHNYTDLARVHLRLGHPGEAIAVGLRKLRGGDVDAEILGHLSEAYAQRRDWVNAFAYAKRETAARDSLAKEERFRQLKNLQISYETTQREEENSALREGLRLTRYLVWAIGTILVLSAFLLVALFVHRRRQDRVNQMLKEQLDRIRSSEAALSESWRRQRAILDNSSDVMWVKDGNGRYTAVNAAFSVRFGRSKEDLEGRTTADIFSTEDVAALSAQERRVVEVRRTVREEHDVVVNGVAMVVERTVSPVLDADGLVVGTTGITRDITDRRRAEAQLRHAQKLESLSVLAGGIAHDFNNLLVGILGNTELARFDVEPDHPVRESLEHIEVAARRAAELTRQMLDYTGKSQIEMRELDLSAVIGGIASDIGRVIPQAAVLRLELEPSLPPVSADAAQVAQVVMSLVTNAADALTEGTGTIAIRTELVRIGAGAAQMTASHEAHGALTEGAHVVIEVSDSGHGMSAETRRRIFEPFFTTRFLGRGLSLAAVQGILRGHRATIEVESVEGRGSRFRVYFPAHVAAPAMEPQCEAAGAAWVGPERRARPRELVLVVDDERTVREFARRVLERSGFNVVTAEDGVEGIALVERHRDELSAVLLDVMMPRVGGHAALPEMRRIVPELPVLFMSGFTGETAAAELRQTPFVEFLAKPFSGESMLETLRTMIDESAGRVAVAG